MEYKFSSLMIRIGLLITTVLVSGCATNRINHTNEVSVPFERVPSEDIHISKVRAYEDRDELVIFGKVKRGSQNCCDPARGHVDIVVIGPEGFILDVISTFYSPRNILKVRSRSSRFAVRLPYTLPEEATVRITYHNSLEATDSVAYVGDMFVCEQNMAMLIVIPSGRREPLGITRR